MQDPEAEGEDDGLPPPGRRSGAGAQSVLPYLTKTLQAKPAPAPEPRDLSAQAGGMVFTSAPQQNH